MLNKTLVVIGLSLACGIASADAYKSAPGMQGRGQAPVAKEKMLPERSQGMSPNKQKLFVAPGKTMKKETRDDKKSMQDNQRRPYRQNGQNNR